jgi:hypothetical protein
MAANNNTPDRGGLGLIGGDRSKWQRLRKDHTGKFRAKCDHKRAFEGSAMFLRRFAMVFF